MHDIDRSTKEQFAVKIIERCSKNNIDVIESIALFCEDNQLEIEDILHLLDKSMKDKIKMIAIEKRYVLGIKPTHNLDV